MEYILGIDGGGTKTIAVVADLHGNILGMGLSSGSNYHAVGLENAIKAIKDSSKQAISNANVSTIKSACFGLAGAGRISDHKILFSKLENLIIANKILLKHDAYIALAGATICQPGVIIIAGTGSMAFGMNHLGKEERSNGWGYLLGDEGSAYYIGRKALSYACKAFDGRGKKTALLEAIIDHFVLDDFNQIVKKVYSKRTSAQDIANLAPIVSQQASQGDKIALDIMNDSAFELALSVKSVIKKLDMDNERVLVATAGSVFKSGEVLLGNFRQYLNSDYPLVEIIYPNFEPVIGALLILYNEIGIKPDRYILDNLRKGGILIEKDDNV